MDRVHSDFANLDGSADFRPTLFPNDPAGHTFGALDHNAAANGWAEQPGTSLHPSNTSTVGLANNSFVFNQQHPSAHYVVQYGGSSDAQSHAEHDYSNENYAGFLQGVPTQTVQHHSGIVDFADQGQPGQTYIVPSQSVPVQQEQNQQTFRYPQSLWPYLLHQPHALNVPHTAQPLYGTITQQASVASFSAPLLQPAPAEPASGVQRHAGRVNGLRHNPLSVSGSGAKEKTTFTCPVQTCSEDLCASRSTIGKHFVTAHPACVKIGTNRPYRCIFLDVKTGNPCTKHYKSSNTLGRHIQDCHAGAQGRANCENCGSRILKRNMARHLKSYCSKNKVQQ